MVVVDPVPMVLDRVLLVVRPLADQLPVVRVSVAHRLPVIQSLLQPTVTHLHLQLLCRP